MAIYVLAEALIGVIAAIIIVVKTEKTNPEYGKLDRIGRVTNVLLCIVYANLAPAYLLIGALSDPVEEGFLWVLGLIVGVIISSASMFCSIGIGLSVALRKKGESIPSFISQFVGLAAIGIAILLYGLCTGNILATLN